MPLPGSPATRTGSGFEHCVLTEELVEEGKAKLIPIVAYPETAVVWEGQML